MISSVSCEPSLVLRSSLHKCMVLLFSLLWWNAGEKAGWVGEWFTLSYSLRDYSPSWWWWHGGSEVRLLKSRWIKRGEWQCPLTVSSPPEVPKPLKGCHSLLSKIVALNSTSPEHSNGHIQWCTLLMPQVFIDPIKLLMTVNQHNMWLPNCMPWKKKHIFLLCDLFLLRHL